MDPNEFPDDCLEIGLKGGIPYDLPDDFFSHFTSVKSVDLSDCNLTALPSSLFLLETVEHVDISNNRLATIPLEFCLLPRLVTLRINGNPGADLPPFAQISSDQSAIISLLQRVGAPMPPPPTRQFWPYRQAPNIFSFMSYNILAPSCVNRPAYPLSLGRFLDSEYRLPLIQAHIRLVDADILCLQEVEARFFRDLFDPMMQERGFTGSHCPKGRANTMTDPDRRDRVIGQATFVNNDRFEILRSQSIVLRSHRLASQLENAQEIFQHDEVAQMTLVRPMFGRPINIVVSNLHLYWGADADDVRAAQLYLAVEAAIEFGEEVSPQFDVILTGDFNAEPGSMALAYLRSRGDFVSVYPQDISSRLFTQWPPYQSFKHIDHIFTTCYGIEPVSFLQTEDTESIAARYIAFPAEHYPSDHLYIVGLFRTLDNHALRPARAKAVVRNPEEQSPKYVITKPTRTGALTIVKRGNT